MVSCCFILLEVSNNKSSYCSTKSVGDNLIEKKYIYHFISLFVVIYLRNVCFYRLFPFLTVLKVDQTQW